MNQLKNNFMKTKRIILALSLALAGFAIPVNAQWAVIDPTNLVQNILTVTKTASTASGVIDNVKESVKIYNQGKEYYDALKSVHNLIKDARKVQLTVAMISDITKIYVNGFDKMLTDPNFSPDELAAISTGYAKLLEEGGALITELKNIVTPSNGLSLSDKERMDVIDQVYNRMKEYRSLTQYFTNKNISVSYLRAKQANDTDRVMALYGNPNERYW
jgi:hypothetical protein